MLVLFKLFKQTIFSTTKQYYCRKINVCCTIAILRVKSVKDKNTILLYSLLAHTLETAILSEREANNIQSYSYFEQLAICYLCRFIGNVGFCRPVVLTETNFFIVTVQTPMTSMDEDSVRHFDYSIYSLDPVAVT